MSPADVRHLVPVPENVEGKAHVLDGGTCPGPAGGALYPCALSAFHGGDHIPAVRA